MEPIQGDYGICYFGDCLQILPTLEGTEMLITDFPYNIDAGVSLGIHYASTRQGIQTYNDLKPLDEYHRFLSQCYTLFKQKSQYGVFTCGFLNLGWWLCQEGTSYLIWLRKNSGNRGFNAFYNIQEPMIWYGKAKRKYQTDVMDFNSHNSFLCKKKDEYLHPHPKPIELWEDLIVQMHPQSVCDPMLGSGTTAEVCEKWGIPWVGIELESKYAVDIRYRVKKGQETRKNKEVQGLGGY